MKRKYLVILLGIFLLVSCNSGKNTEATSPKDTRLSDSLLSFDKFSQYYSMDVTSFERVVGDIVNEKEVSYILGQVDQILIFNPIYLDIPTDGQISIDKTILSNELEAGISDFIKAKKIHLKFLKEYLQNNDLATLDMEEYENLREVLKDINVDIKKIESEEDYIGKLNNAIDIMKEIENK